MFSSPRAWSRTLIGTLVVASATAPAWAVPSRPDGLTTRPVVQAPVITLDHGAEPHRAGGAGARSRVARWNPEALREQLCSTDADGTSRIPEVRLDLFEESTAVLGGGTLRRDADGGVTWQPQVMGGNAGDSAALAIDALCGPDTPQSARLTGQIPAGGHLYTVDSYAPGLLRIQERSATADLDEPARLPIARAAAGARAAGTGLTARPAQPTGPKKAAGCQGASDVSVIDMAIFYTDEAAAQAGGDAVLTTRIQQAVARTNKGFTNSNLPVRVRAVRIGRGSAEPSFPGDKKDLGDYQKWAYQQSEYAKYGADDIGVLTTGAGGVGYVIPDAAPNQWANMVYQMGLDFLDYVTINHEFGHNMGLNHDWTTDPSPGTYPYSHGWIPSSKQWRDIMSYSGGCNGCTQINYYSDAKATYAGEPLGAPDSAPQPSDAVRIIRKNAPVIAKMQPQKTPAVYCRLTLSTTPSGGGTATADTPGPYEPGTSVGVTATPASGYRFAGWTLNGKNQPGTNPRIQVPVTTDSTLTARFSR